MNEIVLNLHKRYQRDEIYLIRRLARIICRDDLGVREEESGYKYCLDYRSNDWFATGISKDGKVAIAYRYGMGGNKPMMDALQMFLSWTFDYDR